MSAVRQPNALADFDMAGRPSVLTHLGNAICSTLSPEDAKTFPSACFKMMSAHGDLQLVSAKFLHWMLVDETWGVINVAASGEQREAIEQVAALYSQRIIGRNPGRPAWNDARSTIYGYIYETVLTKGPSEAAMRTAAIAATDLPSMAPIAAAGAFPENPAHRLAMRDAFLRFLAESRESQPARETSARQMLSAGLRLAAFRL
jgi:hypothetical protein